MKKYTNKKITKSTTVQIVYEDNSVLNYVHPEKKELYTLYFCYWLLVIPIHYWKWPA